ncbi:hypothetical protein KY290_013598 [Solanum tuberosum]|uniref:Myosin motor domain-containing protein n=1 Tax=Solanum tuberosum TaxID=4113 RepID=A0ABQ7VM53_SOLTU|nr:hypothetical protein KY289_013725 [Solanum tuberosum]KAH0717046.1 hypothetical protein KY285_013077 [Solanum tuberosum]KAH0769617.1 hypothetical protein KY290_013598 [Solanum tuberosum]
MEVVVLDRFSGNTDPEDWIYRAERYFTFLGFCEEQWLPLHSFYLDGEALEWFRWMFRNKQFFDWNHFKKKILALLQKLEDKCSFISPQLLVEDAGISAATVVSREISSPLAEENSNCVDNVESHPELFGTFIVEHSSHVDNLFDKMPTRVFTKEVKETSSDLEDIQPLKSLNEFFHSCCPIVVAEVQTETPIKMLDEESPGPERSKVQVFDECSRRDMSKRYSTTATSLDLSSSKHKIAFETFGDKYLPKFSLEPETINDLYLDSYFLKIVDNIPPSTMPSNEMMFVVERGISTDGFNAHNILCQFSFNPNVNSSFVFVHGTATNVCVWDPGISFNSMDPTSCTDTTNVDLLQSLGYTNMFCFIAYANSPTQVWDPGQQSFGQWAVADEMVMMESEVHDTYSEVNRVFDDSFVRVASREIQPIAPLDIIRLPKLFRFLQRLLAQLTGGLQGCIKSTMNLIEHDYATGPDLEFKHILVGYGADGFIILIMRDTLDLGDKIIDFPPNFSLYEFTAFQACENNHWSLSMSYSEVELVKDASIVDDYIVHKSMLVESKNTSILVSCGKFKPIMRLMCYLAYFGGHRRVEECTVAKQIQLAKLGKASGAAMRTSILARSQAFLVIILEQNHQCLSLLCETPMEVNKKCRLRDPESSFYLKQSYCYEIASITNAHDYININNVLGIIRLSKKEQMAILRIMASVMVLGNMECSKGNEIISSILEVESIWFQLHTTIAALYTHSSLERFHIILSVWFYSNLEDKVLIEDESIVMNQVQPNIDIKVTQVVIGLTRAIGPKASNRSSFIWDPGPFTLC